MVTFFLTNLRFDIRDNSHFASVQEVFAHRHLFAHQGGVVDAQYLDHIEAVLGMPERQRVEARVLAEAQVQRLEDAEVLWFEPLNKRFAHLIEESKRFILGMPQ